LQAAFALRFAPVVSQFDAVCYPLGEVARRVEVAETGQPPQSVSGEIPSVKVVQDLPLIFADGVLSQAWGANLSKFYLSRIDSDPQPGLGPGNKVVPLVQIVMPIDGFVQMVAFFEMRLRMMVNNKVITQDMIDKARQLYADIEDAT
jgi:hypothetical protein